MVEIVTVGGKLIQEKKPWYRWTLIAPKGENLLKLVRKL